MQEQLFSKSYQLDDHKSNGISDEPKRCLAKSVTEDDTENSEATPTSFSDAEYFLERYDEMMRLQKDEMSMTLQHLIPLLELLESIGTQSRSETKKHQIPYAKEFTCDDLKVALRTIEHDNSLRYVLADAQWILVLRLLTENSADDDRISCAEIVMCYRTCVLGMQTLQQMPEIKSIRSRIRKRSLCMLSTFKSSTIEITGTIHRAKGQRRHGFAIIVTLLLATMMSILVLLNMNPINSSFKIFCLNDFLKMPVIPGPKVPPFQVESEESRLNQMQTNGINLAKSPKSFTGLDSIVSQSMENQPARMSSRIRVQIPTTNQNDFSEPTIDKNSRSLQKGGVAGILSERKTVETIIGGVVAVGVVSPLGAALGSAAVTGLPTLASIGATVVLSTLLAHGIRDWFSFISSKLRTRK